MNKRIRRKLHKGEFKELGYEVTCQYTIDEATLDTFLIDIIDVAESKGWSCGGGFDVNGCSFILTHAYQPSRKYTKNISIKDVEYFFNILKKQPFMTKIVIKDAFDVWYEKEHNIEKLKELFTFEKQNNN